MADDLTIDINRTAPARIVEDIDADGAQPGDVEPLAYGGVVWGYGFACPGCGSKSYLALDEENPPPRWSVTAGDIRKPDAVSLSPSILHDRSKGGCGWHGYLTRGIFTSV